MVGPDRSQSAAEIIGDLHARSAEIAEMMADHADALAAILEQSARRGDAARRLEIARREREIAAIQHRNASRLRQAGSEPVVLEHLPRLLAQPDSAQN